MRKHMRKSIRIMRTRTMIRTEAEEKCKRDNDEQEDKGEN